MAVCIGLSPPKGATQIQENDTIIGGCGSKRMYSGEDSDLGCQKRHAQDASRQDLVYLGGRKAQWASRGQWVDDFD